MTPLHYPYVNDIALKGAGAAKRKAPQTPNTKHLFSSAHSFAHKGNACNRFHNNRRVGAENVQ